MDEAHLERLDEASAVEAIFPNNFLQSEGMDDIRYRGTLEEIDTDRR